MRRAPIATAHPVAYPPGAVDIGDSVMLGALPQLEHAGISVDAAQDRAFIAGIDVAQNLRVNGGLRRTVTIHLGTNGPITPALFNEMMDTLHGVPRVIFLTIKAPRAWEGEVNATLRASGRHRRQAHLIDWHHLASTHPTWLASDDIHLTVAGARGYATLITSDLRPLHPPTHESGAVTDRNPHLSASLRSLPLDHVTTDTVNTTPWHQLKDKRITPPGGGAHRWPE